MSDKKTRNVIVALILGGVIFVLCALVLPMAALGMFNAPSADETSQSVSSQISSGAVRDSSQSTASSQQHVGAAMGPGDSNTAHATLSDFLRTSLQPKDQVLYVWGGGWNEEDTGGNEEANSMGLAPSWKTFFDANKENYDAATHAYDIHNGLDCSGYVGWTLHNTLKDGQDYVSLSENYGDFLAAKGYGEARSPEEITEILPGDLMYTGNGHIYIVLGQFDDGSVLLMHSSPPGVRMSGTAGTAYETALLYQDNGWDPLVSDEYRYYSQFRFNQETLPDADHLREMTPDQVVDFLYQTSVEETPLPPLSTAQ